MAILDEKTIDFISNSSEQTTRLGVRLGELIHPNDFVCLSGDLGSGKTTFAQGIGRGWGAGRRVTSPTFTLVNEYPRYRDGRILYHIDCYRLEGIADISTVGLEDVFDSLGAYMIEWAERIQMMLPADRLWLELWHINETRRGMRIKAEGKRSEELLQRFRLSAFGI